MLWSKLIAKTKAQFYVWPACFLTSINLMDFVLGPLGWIAKHFGQHVF